MPSYFFDSSAIVKRYYQEVGSLWVQAVCNQRTRPALFLAQIARVEVVAALRRKGRLDQLHVSYVDALVSMFERHLALSVSGRPVRLYHVIPVDDDTLDIASELCNRFWNVDLFPLRALDAI